MADIVGLLASVAGVATAGIQISALLYKTVQEIRGLNEEITSVARDVKILSAVFGELSTAIQTSQNNGIKVSTSCMDTLVDLIQDSQHLYGKIGDAVEGSKSLVRARWFFRRQGVQLWKAEISKNVAILNLLITTLMWAETRRKQMLSEARLNSNETVKAATGITKDNDFGFSDMLPDCSADRRSSQPHDDDDDEIPALIERQIHETVLCAANLARLHEESDAGAIWVQFTTRDRPDLEPRRYLMRPHTNGPCMRRESFDSRSVWFSEIVTIGDASALAGKGPGSVFSAEDWTSSRWKTIRQQEELVDVDGYVSSETESGKDMPFEEGRSMQMADRLLRNWTSTARNEETEEWDVVCEDEDETGSMDTQVDSRRSNFWAVQEQHEEQAARVAAAVGDDVVDFDLDEAVLQAAWTNPSYYRDVTPSTISDEELNVINGERWRLRRVVKAMLGPRAGEPSDDAKGGPEGTTTAANNSAPRRRNALVPGAVAHQQLLQHQHKCLMQQLHTLQLAMFQ